MPVWAWKRNGLHQLRRVQLERRIFQLTHDQPVDEQFTPRTDVDNLQRFFRLSWPRRK
jgi:hypothetical protein